MKVVIAPDSFKESLSARQVAQAIETGFRQVFPHWEYVQCPMADGGEGSVNALIETSGGRLQNVRVVGPNCEQHEAQYGISGDNKTAFIEMAAASGIELVAPNERNPLTATSYGTGQLIEHALNQGIRHLILCIGGSATNDAGCGMMQALGASFTDESGEELPLGGAALAELANINVSGLDERLKQCEIEVACDVTNPLIGPDGASHVYGPQKGASPEMVRQLDSALAQFSRIVERDLDRSVAAMPGAGAAGGMGAALYAFMDAKLCPGIEIMTRATHLEALLHNANLVLTGEGRLDSQSVNGKVPVGVASIAKHHELPVIAVVGALGDDIEAIYSHGIDAAFDSVYKVTTFEDIVTQAKFNLIRSAHNIAAALKIGQQLK